MKFSKSITFKIYKVNLNSNEYSQNEYRIRFHTIAAKILFFFCSLVHDPPPRIFYPPPRRSVQPVLAAAPIGIPGHLPYWYGFRVPCVSQRSIIIRLLAPIWSPLKEKSSTYENFFFAVAKKLSSNFSTCIQAFKYKIKNHFFI